MTGFQSLWAGVSSPFARATISMIVAGVFVTSGTAKLRSPAVTATAVRNFGIRRLINGAALACALGVLEVVAAVGLLLPPTRGIAAACIVLLSLTFSVLIFRAVKRGRSFPCGCFGDSEELISDSAGWRAILLAVTSAVLLAAQIARPTPFWPDAAPTGLAFVFAAGVLGALVGFRCWRLNRTTAEILDEKLDWEWINQAHRATLAAGSLALRKELYP